LEARIRIGEEIVMTGEWMLGSVAVPEISGGRRWHFGRLVVFYGVIEPIRENNLYEIEFEMLRYDAHFKLSNYFLHFIDISLLEKSN